MFNKRDLIKKNLQIITEELLKKLLEKFVDDNNYLGPDNNKNTILLIEPRFLKESLLVLANTYIKLGNNWNYVFYCGKSFKNKWKSLLPNFIEIRELEHDDFKDTKLYSDFCKKKKLWESLYGEYILTVQLDTWIMNYNPYNINFFINLNKSFIGGNMEYTWGYLDKINIYHNFRNFNGGLSLRKKKDMIKIIDNFPPSKTLDDRSTFLSEHEDVYFITGCIMLNLPIGDDELCAHFSLHNKYYDTFFGIHQPSKNVVKGINNCHKYLKFINKYLKLIN